jgi:acetyltransferase-like isoleucine patch superfamily enzyme
MSAHNLFSGVRNAFWLSDCERVGDNPVVLGRPTVTSSGGRIRIGDRFRLASRPAPSHLSTGPNGTLEIGDDVSIAHGAAIAAHQSVIIKAGTHIGPFVIIMDTNFHRSAGDQSIQHVCRPVEIGQRCRIGSRVTITPGASIGDGAEILTGSVVSSTIPPGACAGGARARVHGLAGDAASRWDGAAARLPILAMEVFGLDVPPELKTSPRELSGWTAGGLTRFQAAIEGTFGVPIDSATLSRCTSLAEIAVAVLHARNRFSGTARR